MYFFLYVLLPGRTVVNGHFIRSDNERAIQKLRGVQSFSAKCGVPAAAIVVVVLIILTKRLLWRQYSRKIRVHWLNRTKDYTFS